MEFESYETLFQITEIYLFLHRQLPNYFIGLHECLETQTKLEKLLSEGLESRLEVCEFSEITSVENLPDVVELELQNFEKENLEKPEIQSAVFERNPNWLDSDDDLLQWIESQ